MVQEVHPTGSIWVDGTRQDQIFSGLIRKWGVIATMKRLICAALLFSLTLCYGQGTQADYDRANSFGRDFAGKVRNERLVYGWLSDGNFWFREDLKAGAKHFYKIEVKSGKKSDLFDHEKVAKTIAAARSLQVDPSKLPFDRVADSLDHKLFSVDTPKTPLTLDWKTYEVSEKSSGIFESLQAFSPQDVRRSTGGGERTEIAFVNKSDEKLKIFWLDEGGEKRPYKVLEPGGTWSIWTVEGHYWITETMSGRAIAVYKPSNGSTAFLDNKPVASQRRDQVQPNVSPDKSKRIEFRQQNAFMVDLATKVETRLTTDGSPDHAYQSPVSWASDSKTVCFYQTEPEESHPLNIVRTTPRDQFQPRLEKTQYLKPGDIIAKPQLCYYKVGQSVKKVPMDLYPNPWDLDQETWLDNDRFVFRYNQRGHQCMRLIELNVATESVRTLIDETVPTFIDWTRKSFFQISPDKKEAIWMSERSGWCHIYLYDLSTGKVKNAVTSGEWVVRNVDSIDWSTRVANLQIAAIDPNQDPYHVHFAKVGLDGKHMVRLTESDGTHRVVYSPKGDYVVDTYSRVDLPPVHELRRVSDGKMVAELVKADATELLATGFRMPIRFVAKGRDGKTDIWGLIHPPQKTDKIVPIVEDIYAGPHDSHVPKAWHTNSSAYRLAELGFAVVRIDGMGTSNRSKAFHDVCWKNIADAGFADRRLWMKAAAEKYPYLDTSRVGITGTSAGGQNTLDALLLQGDFYKVGVADCGCYDNRMDKIWWNEQWMGWPIGPHYEAQSGRTLAKNLTGKLMLMLSENDTNVDPASTWQVVDALIQANKDFDLVVIPNMGHGAVSSPYARRKQYDFLVRNLFGVEPRSK